LPSAESSCAICHEPCQDAIASECCSADTAYSFCRSCARDFIDTAAALGGAIECPSCRAPFTIDLDQEVEEAEVEEEEVRAPTYTHLWPRA